ncbi:MAG: Tm-1-like ATP-binding domain-containing protein [Verrucomicrobia bacterium]|nr:Tm-1-like ATP-binding domain-containing protein [Verrucomicrobiota bacterium]
MATIAVLGTLDTKGIEHAFLADRIRERGHQVLLVDVGTLGEPQVRPDLTRAEVAAAAGIDLAPLVARRDRGEAVTAMTRAAPVLVAGLASAARIQGIISLGGGGGTAIGTAAMRALPIGFPKLMVSTLASGNTAPYVGARDIVMFPSVVDVAGLNRVSREILARAAGAICGMVEARWPTGEDRPVIVASQFGNTTRCVEHARELLERAGYEVLVFAAVGTGGRTLESLVDSGMVAGVLDITTTEWADELVGGVLSAGPHRLEAAARAGVPAIVTPGCLDMVNFGPPDTVPAKFQGRRFYAHNPQVTLMRTTAEECVELGRIISDKLNASRGPVTVLIPLRGISVISAPGQPFHDAAADEALFATLKQRLRPGIPVLELDANINDPAFAEACVAALLNGLKSGGGLA